MLKVGAILFTLAVLFGASHWPTELVAPEGEVASVWLVHYRPDVLGGDAYADLLRELPTDARLVVVVSSREAAETFRRLARGRRIESVQMPSTLTPWARDRYLLFQRGRHVVCLAKPWYDLPAHWQEDAKVPDELGGVSSSLVVVRSPLAPVGGDTILTREHVLVGELSFQEAVERAQLSPSEILHEYEHLFGRTPVVIPSRLLGLSRVHIDLFVAWAGERTLLVADPTLCTDATKGSSLRHERFGLFSHRRNKRVARGLDEVAQFLAKQGFTVRRIPGLFGEPRGSAQVPTVLTYTNAVVQGKRVFLPSYDVPVLDRQARAVWESLGFDCASIRCEQSILSGGAVRCMTNRLQ